MDEREINQDVRCLFKAIRLPLFLYNFLRMFELVNGPEVI